MNNKTSLKTTHKTSESQLLYEIMRELGKYGAIYRTNCGSIRLPNGKYFRALPEGFTDVMFVRTDGKTCFIECKVKPNKATTKQIEFIEKMKRTNCLAGVAYSVGDAFTICELTPT